MSLITAQERRIKLLKVKQTILEIGIFAWMYIFILVWIWVGNINPKPILPIIHVVEMLLCFGLAVLQFEICASADKIVIEYFKDRQRAEVERLNEIIARHIRLGGTYTYWNN